MNEKDKTIEFNPVKDVNKEIINRNSSDVYSSARKNSYAQKPRKKSNDNKGLIYLAIFLTVALIIAIVAGIFIITGTNSINNENEPNENIVLPIEPEEPEEEEIINEENIYNIIFYGETVKKVSEGYTIAADLYDDNLNKVGTRKITITPETVIKESGQRMSAEGFVYTIESLTGEMISVEGKIREKDSVALTLSYDGSFREEMQEPEEPEEEIIEGENTEIPENQENTEETPQTPETPESEPAEQN